MRGLCKTIINNYNVLSQVGLHVHVVVHVRVIHVHACVHVIHVGVHVADILE